MKVENQLASHLPLSEMDLSDLGANVLASACGSIISKLACFPLGTLSSYSVANSSEILLISEKIPSPSNTRPRHVDRFYQPLSQPTSKLMYPFFSF